MSKFSRTYNFINQHSFAKHHLLRAWTKFISWQIRSRISPKLIPLTFIGESKFYSKKGLTGVTGNIYCGLHDFEEMSFLLHFLRNTDTFFDVGANVGSYTILAAGVCGSNSVAFEPVPGTVEILKKNIELNKIKEKVKLVNCAVGNNETTLCVTTDSDTTNHVTFESSIRHETIEIPVIKLNDYQHKCPALMKIDVEGFETEVLNGADQILSNPDLKAIIIELNGSGGRYGYEEYDIHLQLLNFGFEPYQYEPFTRVLVKLDTYGNFNTLYLRDLAFISQRLISAKKFKVFSHKI